jgi:hypothetical protein
MSALIRRGSFATLMPMTRISPPLTGETHEIMRTVVVFPAPLGSEEAAALSFAVDEVDAVHRDGFPELLRQPARFDDRLPRFRRAVSSAVTACGVAELGPVTTAAIRALPLRVAWSGIIAVACRRPVPGLGER